jgi:hypothetical protein
MDRRSRTAIAAVGTLLLVILAACDTDSPTQVGIGYGRSLLTIWPNEDGRSWTYRIHARQWSDPGARIYATRDSVPPIPSMSQIAALLGTQPIGPNPEADSASFQLRFNGFMTTGSGVTAQRLEEIVTRPASSPLSRSALPASAAAPLGFLRELARARPDLAPALAGALAASGAAQQPIITGHPTIFLFGYAWQRTSQWIGSYGDADTALSWKYLTRFLFPGSQFTHRLVPTLAPDVYLHGRILDRRTVVTRDGTFANAIVCLYAVDYGIGTAVDANNPELLGYYRVYSYGTVAYADRVGPVASYERRMVGLGQPSLGTTELDLSLTDRGAPTP